MDTTRLLPVDARLRLRRDALRVALMQGRTREAAWATSRLRLSGIELDPAEARAARAALIRFGRALRSARDGRSEPTPSRAVPIAATPPVARARSRGREVGLWTVIGLIALVISVLVLVMPGEPAATEDDPAASAVAAAASPVPSIRGRTQPIAPPVAVAVAQPTVEPTPDPVPLPTTPTAEVAMGSRIATTSPRPALAGPEPIAPVRPGPPRTGPIAAPLPPTPPREPIVPAGFSRVSGRVVDMATGRPVANASVCVANGLDACTKAPLTDEDGRWTLALRPMLTWNIQFIADGYVASTQRVVPRGGTFPLPDIRLVRKS